MIDSRRRAHGGDVKSAPCLEAPRAAADSVKEQPIVRDFEALVDEHLDFVWRLLRRFGLPPEDADDVAQRVFMIALDKLEELPPGKERMFLYGTARRLAANARRKRHRHCEVSVGEGVEAAADFRALPDDSVELARAARLLDGLLARMPEELSRVLLLAEVEEATVPLIAEFEGIPTGTAASRLRRARELFGKLLARVKAHNPFGGDST